MKNKMKVASLFLLALLVFLPLKPASAKGLMDGQIIFGRSYTLMSGETLQGDLVVFGGSADIEEGALINGDAVVIGGNLTLKGEVTGEVAVIGGQVSLGANSHVHGALTTVGGTLARAEGSQVDGEITNAATSWEELNSNGTVISPPVISTPVIIPPVVTPTVTRPFIDLGFNMVNNMFNSIGQAIGLSVLAMLVVLFLSPQAGRVSNAVITQPVVAGGLGLLTVIVAPIAIVILSITLLLIPVAIIAAMLVAVAAVFGWIALGYEVGMRFTKAIHQDWHPSLSAGMGTFLLTFVTALMTIIPVVNIIGWLAPFLLGLAGLGAVIMTRFGSQAAIPPSAKAAVVPVAPSDSKTG